MRRGTSDWILLAVLALLNVLNFLDRQLLAAVAPKLVAEMGLTNTQLGLLVGYAFVLFFSLATLFLGGLADRTSRTRLVAAGVTLWTVMTAATGAARGFGDLVAARLFIGLGEAALVPSAISLLADRFPPRHLGLACGIFWAGYPVGRALSYLVAAVLAPQIGWRGCYFVLGGLGLVGAAAILAFADRRGGSPQDEARVDRSSRREAARAFAEIPTLRWVVAACVLAAIAASGAQLEIVWLASERGYRAEHAALAGGIVMALASLIGNPLVGALADRWERVRPGGRLRCLAATIALMPLAAAVYVLPPGSRPFYACWFVAQVVQVSWLGTSSAVIEELVPPRVRALTLAAAMVIINLAGIGPAALLVGAIGDARSLTAGLLAVSAIGLGAVLPYLMAAHRYPTDRARLPAATA